ncbi:MAG: hypothetical protein JW982_07820 [Spirochaetes bacterium]|nr:hypothetical protein [Spirochaetota bacterium]
MKKLIVFCLTVLISILSASADDIFFPEQLDLFKYCVPPGTEYGHSKMYESIYGFPQFRLFGWSHDGKIAYSTETAIDGRGGVIFSYVIQDLKTDRIVWKFDDDSFDWEDNYSESVKPVAEISFDLRLKILKKVFREKNIVQSKSRFNKMPVIYKENVYNCDLIIKINENDTYGFQNMDYKVLIRRNDGKSKILADQKNVRADRIYICGWFESPYEKRAAVVIAEEKYVFEGNELFYSILGCNLIAGFK